MSPAMEPSLSNCFLADDVFDMKITLFLFFIAVVIELPSDVCLVRNCEYSEPSSITKSALSTELMHASTSILLACVSSSGDGWPSPWLWLSDIMVPSDFMDTPVTTHNSRPWNLVLL